MNHALPALSQPTRALLGHGALSLMGMLGPAHPKKPWLQYRKSWSGEAEQREILKTRTSAKGVSPRAEQDWKEKKTFVGLQIPSYPQVLKWVLGYLGREAGLLLASPSSQLKSGYSSNETPSMGRVSGTLRGRTWREIYSENSRQCIKQTTQKMPLPQPERLKNKTKNNNPKKNPKRKIKSIKNLRRIRSLVPTPPLPWGRGTLRFKLWAGDGKMQHRIFSLKCLKPSAERVHQ